MTEIFFGLKIDFHAEVRKPAPGERLELWDAVILPKNRAALALAKAQGARIRQPLRGAALKDLTVTETASLASFGLKAGKKFI
ncbi:MAG: hypothetical protein PVI39_04730 [Desulfobacteraceae bacterium]